MAAAGHPAALAATSASTSVRAGDLRNRYSRLVGMRAILAWAVRPVVYIVEYVALGAMQPERFCYSLDL
jgi:hypothetical protein